MTLWARDFYTPTLAGFSARRLPFIGSICASRGAPRARRRGTPPVAIATTQMCLIYTGFTFKMITLSWIFNLGTIFC